MSDYPTPWQRKMMWTALTAFCVVLLILIIGTVIWASANIISFLQPILIPVAIAGDSDLSAGPAGGENVSRNAQSHQGGRFAFCHRLFRPRWIGRMANSDHLDTKREFRKASPCLYRTSPRLCCRSNLSIRSDVRVSRRRPRKVCIDKFYKLARRTWAICFSPCATDSFSRSKSF